MTCYHPIEAEQHGYTKNGKIQLIFKNNPNYKHNPTMKIPCGQCIGCRLDTSIMWAARCLHEAQMHDQNQFITLTYDEQPQYGSLTPPDFVKFMKRYRKAIAPLQIRFYMGAEYGDNLGRPHHHACIFGHEFSDREIFNECEGIYTYYSKSLEELWTHGFCTTQDLTIGNAKYVAQYTLKKINTSQTSPEKYKQHYETTDPLTGEILSKTPEYSTMSRGGTTGTGLGSDWYTKYNSDVFPHDTCIVKGKRIKTPRYYENLLRSSDEDAFLLLKANRIQNAQKHLSDNTPARLRARETCAKLNQQHFTRKLHNDS